MSEVSSFRRGQFVPGLLNAFLHFKMKQVAPLFLTPLMGLLSVLQLPVIQVHVLGAELERPFIPPTSGFPGAAEGETDDGPEDTHLDGSAADREPEEPETSDEPHEESPPSDVER